MIMMIFITGMITSHVVSRFTTEQSLIQDTEVTPCGDKWYSLHY